eukprot:comp19190_c0_seq1/m.21901 comp19190_c0_seq1/g.21901  ORF comp19190_c0_seq1/g.21901 comp19190_c0_seq1/m.21901 type:complete len:766 (-) comp19190_c0_seq1:210-2507(-)
MRFEAAFLAVGLCASAAYAETIQLGLKTLYLYNKDSTEQMTFGKSIFMGLDTPYVLAPALPTLDKPLYNAIVVSSQLAAADLSALRAYGKKFNVRISFLDSTPQAAGLVAATTAPSQFLSMAPPTVSSPFADALCTKCFWPTHVDLAVKPATPNPDTTKPVLVFSAAKQHSQNDTYAAVALNTTYGTEEMHFFFRAWMNELDDDTEMTSVTKGEYTFLNTALANVWFQWTTKGVWLGQRRIFLQAQVDDWFSATAMWNGTEKSFRCNGYDTENAAAYSKALTTRLPKGSDFKFELAFNGAGFTASGLEESGTGVGLDAATLKHVKDFLWVSHTWTHQNLDWSTPDLCNGSMWTCPTNGLRLNEELSFNDKFIRGIGVPAAGYKSDLKNSGMRDTPAQKMFYNDPEGLASHYSPSCLVPPEISGLWPAAVPAPANRAPRALPKNTVAMKALWDNGIRTVTGDNSRDELVNKQNKYHGVWTTVQEYGYDGILIIPRIAVNVDWDVHYPEVLVDQYNTKGACSWSFGPPCPARVTFEQAMARESAVATFGWLQYRQDPFMFHQANLHSFPYMGKNQSLLSIWIDRAVDGLLEYVDKLPITSPRMEVIGQMYRDRMARDNCSIEATMEVVDGKPTRVTVGGSQKCEALLTVNGLHTNLGLDSAKATPYAFENTYSIPISADKKTFNLVSKTAAPVTQGQGGVKANATGTGPVETTQAIPDQSSSSNTGAYIGAAIGCALAAAIAIGAGVYVYRRRKQALPKKPSETLQA